jgi:hypothetical protein
LLFGQSCDEARSLAENAALRGANRESSRVRMAPHQCGWVQLQPASGTGLGFAQPSPTTHSLALKRRDQPIAYRSAQMPL